MKTRIAIIGYGHIGRAVEQAVAASADMELAGIFHHNDTLDSIEADIAALCVPSRDVPAYAERMLEKGISTVDSFDIHTQVPDLRRKLMPVAREHNAVSVISAGWDPGTDSMVRAILLAMAPEGLTYTNFGPGRSMGHTVAVRAIKGVKDALSMTIPLGTGIHRRMVYVELEPGADFATVEKAILTDAYFKNDETHVMQVPSVKALDNVGHGVNMLRYGVSGATHNQRFEFNMSIDNPALTGQVLVATARAAARMKNEQKYGVFTMIEIPPIYLLNGDTEELIRTLV
ncbi:MAG: diaminopimelate dehydrogenase [Bacteroidales bacterium]|nr:diaminopimelate dehydrogenase [Bacteroidales bacterium]MBQ7489570.1 diaminopimelate dehydrogenase [Bacteroidales bacterium]